MDPCVSLAAMNGNGVPGEQSSIQSYRWVRIWLGVGVLCALLLLGNSIRDYFFVSRILSIQQLRRQVTQRIAAFEHNLRETWTPGTSRLKLLTDEIAAGPQHPVWIVLRDGDGQVIEQSGTQVRQLFTHQQEADHFREREPLFDTIQTSQGEVVVEVFPVRAGFPRPTVGTVTSPPPRGGPFFAVEVAMLLSSADAANLWPIRRNLVINIASALALLLTVGLTARGFRSYVKGKQLEQQVEVARQVQANLLPRQTLATGNVDVAVEYQPAQEVGGDFYDTFNTESGWALVIGDVSGKGIPAALLMGVIHGAVRSCRWTDSRESHQEKTAELNRLLCERASRDRFASMFWSYCDPDRKAVHYVNAGHCAPVLVGLRKGQSEIRRLDAGGPVLGVLPEAAYTQGCAEIQPGDVMVLYSDGLVEATNKSGEEFGERRLVGLVSKSSGETPERIRNSILAGLRDFLQSATAQDDLTVVVAKFGAL